MGRIMASPFRKPATSYAQQVALLRQRGMIIDDAGQAEFYLQHLNYYRLVGYWLPFEADHTTHRFRRGAQFKEVLDLYIFDRELRLLVLDAIERIEVSVRSQWAYQMAHRHGPHAHLDPALAHRCSRYDENCETLKKEVERSREVFISHHKLQYAEPLPPVWVVCEVMSLGQLSRWYGNLRPMATRRAIADVYELDQRLLESWLHHLTHVRNVCAHHGRLWNREFTITPRLPRSRPEGLREQFAHGVRKPYNTLVIILFFLDIIAPDHHWRTRLKRLLDHHGVNVADMGFPTGWEQMPLWVSTP